MPSELYRRFRPKTLDEVVGQKSAVKVLSEMFRRRKVPQALMLTGPSGCGKTTLGRIVAAELGCDGTVLIEVNTANYRGIDMAREIEGRMKTAAWGKCKVWIIDEAHGLTKEAQNALLKPFEEPPPHVNFILCTTDPSKLISTVRNRMTEVKLERVKQKDIHGLLRTIMQRATKDTEGDRRLSDDVYDRIVEIAEGSPRQALVLLNKIWKLKEEDAQLDALRVSESARDTAVELALALMHKAKWPIIARLLSKIDKDPEELRRLILAIATNEVLKAGSKNCSRAALILDQFSSPYFDVGSAKAMFTLDCFKVIHWRAD